MWSVEQLAAGNSTQGATFCWRGALVCELLGWIGAATRVTGLHREPGVLQPRGWRTCPSAASPPSLPRCWPCSHVILLKHIRAHYERAEPQARPCRHAHCMPVLSVWSRSRACLISTAASPASARPDGWLAAGPRAGGRALRHAACCRANSLCMPACCSCGRHALRSCSTSQLPCPAGGVRVWGDARASRRSAGATPSGHLPAALWQPGAWLRLPVKPWGPGLPAADKGT